jgi:hypothetical protein
MPARVRTRTTPGNLTAYVDVLGGRVAVGDTEEKQTRSRGCTSRSAARQRDRRQAAPGPARRIRLAGMPRSRARSWVPALMAAILLSAVAPSAQAHTLSLRRAHADTLFFVRGIAYAFDVSADPTVRCARPGGDPHAVSCSWRFRRLDHLSGTEGACTGTVRVSFVGSTFRLHRAIVRPRRCDPVAA